MEKQQIAKILRRILWVGIPLSAILHELAVLLSYDKYSNYFVANAPLPILAGVITTLLFALAIACAVIDSKKSDAISPFGNQVWIAIPAALGFGASGILLLVDYFKTEKTLSLVAAIFLLLSAAHVLLSETDKRSKPLGFVPPIACALLVVTLYFDSSLEMNAPMKVFAQCALLPLMLYFTAELRYLINCPLPRLFSALALGSLAASSLCLLTVPVASLTGRLENQYCLIASLAVIGINATVALRQWRYLQAPNELPIPDETPTTDELPSPDENDTKETDAQ